MNYTEEHIKHLEENIEEAKELVENGISYLKKLKPFGEFYEENKSNENFDDEDLIDMYFQAYRQYDTEKEYLYKAKEELEEFKKMAEIPAFDEEYERLIKVQRKLNEEINKIFKNSKRLNIALILPENHHGWFSLPYIKEKWNDYLKIRNTDVITNKEKLYPVVEIIEFKGNLQFNYNDSEDIPELNIELTKKDNKSIIHTVDLTNIIQVEEDKF